MKNYFIFCIVLALTISCTPEKKEEFRSEKNKLLDTQWILRKPQPASTCDIVLSFQARNKMFMDYKGKSSEGFYEVDSVLSKYIKINIFNKQGWDDACEINPEYLSLYDTDTQFSFTILDNKLYFQKSEKVIVFDRMDQSIRKTK